jgi:outer membrane immunogenic protein
LDVNDQSAAKSGYSVGGGVEYMLTHHWSTKLEYLYLKFRDTDAPPLTSGADYKLPFSESIIRMGLNYKF